MDIAKFIQDNIYNPEYGAKPAGVAIPIIAGLGSFMGLGVTGGVIAMAAGTLLSPVINKVLSKVGQFLGISSAPVPGGVVKEPSMAVGEGKQATEEKPFSLSVGNNVQEGKHIRSPILENMTVPEKDIADVVERRRSAMNDALQLASMPAGTNKGLEIRVKAGWEQLSEQEKQIGDFTATLKNYQKEQAHYAGDSGERERLKQSIASKLGVSTADAESIVPTLPEVPRFELRNGTLSENPILRKDYMPLDDFEAQYNKERSEGKLPESYKDKTWNELDTLAKHGYAFNHLNAEIVAVKQSIDVNKINPDGEVLGHPDYKHCNHKKSFTCFGLYDDGSKWTRQNAAAVVTTLLARNPDDKVAEWGNTGTTNASLISLYADEAIKVSASHPESVSEYQKIKHYVSLTQKRSNIMARIKFFDAPLKSLVDFRNDGLTKSHEEAQRFIKLTLPAINQLIDAKAVYEDAGLKLTSVKKNGDSMRIVFAEATDSSKTYSFEGKSVENGEFRIEKINDTATEPTTLKLSDVNKIKVLVKPNALEQMFEKKPEEGVLESIAKAATDAVKMGVKFTGNEKISPTYPFVPSQPLPFLNLNNVGLAA